jgi:hypothetical protein
VIVGLNLKVDRGVEGDDEDEEKDGDLLRVSGG